MTLRDFLGALRRRWYVALVGILVAPALYVGVTSKDPVYTGQVRLVFLSPLSKTNANSLQQPSPVSIAAAAVIRSTGRPLTVVTSDSQTPLYGRGVTDGTATILEHAGNQWRAFAPTPYVRIEATADTPEEVERRITAEVDHVLDALRTLENEFGADDALRVSVTQSPETPTILAVPGSPSRALMGSALLGFGITVASVASADRVLARLRRRGRSAAQAKGR